MAYKGFNAKGFRLAAIFDSDPAKIGKKQDGFTVLPLSELRLTVRQRSIGLAMVAVPADAAQEVVDQLVAAGIRGILNFAPVWVNVPSHVALNSVDLSVQLEQLSFQVNLLPLEQTG
jgi:redox-sensing transcriptional repressor